MSQRNLLESPVWQVAVCEVVAVEPADSYVDAADRPGANWVTLLVTPQDDRDGFVRPGERIRAVHDPAYSLRVHRVVSPESPWEVGQRRRVVLEHIVIAGIAWKTTRLAVIGPRVRT